jgi:hypothetical protein
MGKIKNRKILITQFVHNNNNNNIEIRDRTLCKHKKVKESGNSAFDQSK